MSAGLTVEGRILFAGENSPQIGPYVDERGRVCLLIHREGSDNVVTIQQKSATTGQSAINFLDRYGHERTAMGYGNLRGTDQFHRAAYVAIGDIVNGEANANATDFIVRVEIMEAGNGVAGPRNYDLARFTWDGSVRLQGWNGTVGCEMTPTGRILIGRPSGAGTIDDNESALMTRGITTFVNTDAGSAYGNRFDQYSSDSTGARMRLRKARGLQHARLAVQSGNRIGQSCFDAWDGNEWLECARAEVTAIGTVGDNRVPTRYSIYTSTDASPSVLGECLRLECGTSKLFSALDVEGDIAVPLGKTLGVKAGTNGLAGTFTMTSGTASVNSTAITADMVVIPTLKTAGGTPGTASPLIQLNPGVGFSVVGANTDNSTYNWIALKIG